MSKRLLFSWLFLLAAAGPATAAGSPDLAPVKRWLVKQAELRTLQADFTQTRSYKNLRDPLSSPGHLWYSAPNAFRWEIGEPPKTVVLRKGEEYYVITPGKKRAERTAAGNRQMAMMDFPFARNFDDFNRRFEGVSMSVEGARCHLEILPRDAQARNALASIRIDFDTETGHLNAFEFVTRDGSSLRNEFSNVRDNQKIDPREFDYDFTGYEVVDAK
ncbi:MAG: outer membrane lipoprotein carrier protein LolA [Gluconacetobacter diazotrophicus]|nr:outer membrane lipoprotein carrier protein LolA [Gluconacetobacter diazotrophicus]